MTERVAKLRRQSLEARPYLSTERAELLTRFWREVPDRPVPVQRALAFRYIMEHKAVYLGPGELIVGERGPEPKATPTYPELCCHSLEDLDILDSRPKIPFAVSRRARNLYEREIIPFWRGRSIRDRLFAAMEPEWLAAYEAGMFTEFMEQRAPGHTVLGDKLYRQGLLGVRREIEEQITQLEAAPDGDPGGPPANRGAPEGVRARLAELQAMAICIDAVIRYAARHAETALALAETEPDPVRRAELKEIARVCRRVPGRPPETFHEALQAYWFVHLGVITELNTWDSFNPGRLDQHLLPFYRRGLEEGTLTRERAEELLQCFWIKFNNQPAPPKVGVTAAESGTYTDFANINIGGLRPDGADGVNEVSYLLLDVIEELRLLQPSTNIQLSKRSPDTFLHRACEIIRQGWGQPSVFNADEIVMELLRQGKTIEDARCGGASGCVETGAFGKEAYILTGYLNLVKVLELTMHDGRDPCTGNRLGPRTGEATGFTSFEDLFEAFRRQLGFFVDVKIRGNNTVERLYAGQMPAPFLSVLIDDCVTRGRDYNDGGARYDTSYIQGVGLGTLTDSLSALKHHVFERRTVTMGELLQAIGDDFSGYEPLRQMLVNRTPRYGNDDDRADRLMQRAFLAFYEAVDGLPNTRGGTYRVNMLPTTCHVYFGSVTGATPDGRHAGLPVSEGISPVQGADRRGPTAVILSAGKLDHVRTGGTLLNMKFSPQVLDGKRGLQNLGHLIRAYFRLDGHHVQFNVVRAETLRAAQQEPERYRDLIVRVAGYSDYFCDLSRVLQDEIISRTEHGQVTS